MTKIRGIGAVLAIAFAARTTNTSGDGTTDMAMITFPPGADVAA